MQLNFIKYTATGNDFILINNFHHPHYTYDPMITQQLCHRQFGIGADGIITIEYKKGYDFSILHYNSDGSRGGGVCGNGARAALHYAEQLGLMKQSAYFWAMDGLHTGYIRNDLIYLGLKDVNRIIPIDKGYFIYNGTRHYVEFIDNVQAIDMKVMGFPRRKVKPFEKKGVNVNFVQIVGNTLLIRTCECGLESEPLSCGTGAAASALVASKYYGLTSPVEVITRGGKLWVEFNKLSKGHFTHIYLFGLVYKSFHGKVNIKSLPNSMDNFM